ncbi:hypothetical protein [Pseudoalteromonas phage H103]|uniref:hypothetical protein n=1 Tax=Pseudoalteromonas phage H103 TaxID=1636200 RepID=UPI0006BDA74A|nr:hypothetical protein AVU31_gp67 [Pseudoalteromonas phage H103]AKA61243.1 hypothetical protein [Pseudoalteromonas phage H103]
MKLPVTISIKYIGESDLPIMTVNSLHVITESADTSILTDYVNMFSSVTFSNEDIESAITECQSKHVFNIKSDIEWLSFSLV